MMPHLKYASKTWQINIQTLNFKFSLPRDAADPRLNAICTLLKLKTLQYSTVFACGPSGFVTQAEALFGQCTMLYE